jgi:ABC-type uncharacterized transport system substrate-binding protein
MWPALKRLSLGTLIIAATSAVLLLSDLGHRKASVEPIKRLAILQHSSQPILDEGVRGMIDGLAAAGFVDGKNVSIRRYNAENDLPTANAIAKEMTSGAYDLVLTASTLSLQAVANANRAGKTLHVFALVSDPFGAGVGISRENPLDHPRYLVGYGTMQPVAETFELAKRVYPDLKIVGEVWNPAEANSEAQTKLARETCRRLGIQLVEANVDKTSDVFEAASSLVARGIDALWVGGDVTVMAAIDPIVSAARKGHIPVFTSMPGATERGALFDFGANYYEVGQLAGKLAGDLLNGRDPSTIPIKNVLPITLLVNREALKGLKDPWRFPDDVLRRAEQVGAQGAAAPAQPAAGRMYKVGIVYFAPEPGVEECMRGLVDGFRDAGFVEGRNLDIRKSHAQAEIANIPQLLQNYDAQGLDLIIPMSTPCLTAACGTVKHTPVVFTYVYDPIAAGAGTDFSHHLPNVTGVGSFPPVAKTMDLIRQLIPGVKVIGTLYNSSEANSRKVVEVARREVAQRGMRLEEVTVTNASEVFQAAQAAMARGVQVLWIAGDNTAIQGFDAVVKVANDARIPLVTNDIEPVAKASLATVGIGFYQPGYAAAKMAARVLLGAKPADIPIENVAVPTVAVNLLVARKLGIPLSEEVLHRADVLVDETGTHRRSTAGATSKPATPAPLGKKWNIDILEYINVVDVEEGEKGIQRGLHDAGLVEGRDYQVRVRNAQGDMPTLGALVDAAVSEGADLLMTLSTPTLQAAIQRTHGLPIVFTFVADAVAAGAGRSNDDHLPQVTGVPTTSAYEDLITTVRECLPAVRRIGTLFVPAEVNSVFNKNRLTETAQGHGIEVLAVAANTSAEMPDAAAALCNQSPDAIVQIAGNLTSAAFASITQAARRARVPLFGSLASDFENGAAVVVARDYFEGGREAGMMAARVMRGESPAALPFQPLRKTRTLVNLRAAQACGLTVPEQLLKRPGVIVKQ